MPNDVFRAQRGTAILVASLVQTIAEVDPSFQERFIKRIEAAYSDIRDDETYHGGVNEMELLSWVREYLTGFSLSKGQQEPVNAGYKPR